MTHNKNDKARLLRARSGWSHSVISLIFLLTACSVSPEKLKYNQDNCSFCKMTLVDEKFGAELVTAKGKIFKFDDIKCMVLFLNTPEGKNEYAYQLATDYSLKSNELIPVKNALYLHAQELRSPMGGNIASFANQPDLQLVQNVMHGQVLNWEQVMQAFQ
ncbi:MAG: hypothetical protein OJF59_001492 [Cytophagales bacterium]|jgi:copper chaperone NosL|nr:nitrous oxide reductase accessory protein NosL [Bacteroidota bacterium]MBS1980424.1 nitrous oxide reductase accessory protein NosL [Bacteroidota bacterium]WHZ07739.1 MAG: hypothetical protein OJF59_001492 [Cytophagales bacterium]